MFTYPSEVNKTWSINLAETFWIHFQNFYLESQLAVNYTFYEPSNSPTSTGMPLHSIDIEALAMHFFLKPYQVVFGEKSDDVLIFLFAALPFPEYSHAANYSIESFLNVCVTAHGSLVKKNPSDISRIFWSQHLFM